MKTVYLGSGQFGIDCLKALGQSGHSIGLIVTQPAKGAGRGRRARPTPVAQWASANAMDFVETADANAPEVVERIAACGPEVIVVIAFGQKIGPELISLPGKAAINVHGSLLPKYRGAAPVNWAIINGETQTGISIITLAEKMDAGQILGQAQTDIGPQETAGGLHDRLAKLAAPLLVETLDRIAEGTATYTEQDHSKATLAPKLKKTDGFLDFSEAADVLARKVRGLWPWPGACADYISKQSGKSTRVTIAAARKVEVSDAFPAGTLDEALNVVCGRNALKITKVKPAGASLMDFKAFVNGRRTRPGDMFVKIGE